MRRISITILFTALLAIGWQKASGFALLGPTGNNPNPENGVTAAGDSWQTLTLGYGIPGEDIGSPKNIGQGYRRNTPVLYYAFDPSFEVYFGSNGMAAVTSAFDILNALTNADDLQLSQFPMDSQVSLDGEALGLMDLKSTVLYMMMEQMGLAEPERSTWLLHDRVLVPSSGVCPQDEDYIVIQRNYDPISQVYSSYVNGTLYTYDIADDCGDPSAGWAVGIAPGPSTGESATTYPYPTDVDSFDNLYAYYTAVAGLGYSLQNGAFYTGLTYDDVGGLRYLYSTNNVVEEDPAPDAYLEVTNSQLQLLITSDLGQLLQFAQTNPPATLQTAYPNLEINGYSTYYTIVSNPIVYAYYTNEPGQESGTLQLVTGTNGYTYTPQTNYVYSFGNVVMVHYYTNTVAKLVTVKVAPAIGGPGDILETNTTTKTVILTNVPSGDYYLIPTNSCGYDIVETLRSNNLAAIYTNVIVGATNTTTTSSNSLTQSYSETEFTYFTNDWFEYYACNFQTSGPALYQGIGKINFVEGDYDSTLGTFYPPITNYYTMTMVSNSQAVVQYFMRVVTQPDFLFDAADLTSPNDGAPSPGYYLFYRTINFDQDNAFPNEAGPGTINPPTDVTFNDVGDGYLAGLALEGINTNAYLQLPQDAEEYPLWGSFDNSTNPPVVYPSGASIQNLESEILIQITPTTLPTATNGVAYSQTFTTTGGSFTQPYTWSLGIDPSTQTTNTLPTGLTLSSGGTISGTPDDTPATYDFVLEMTDANGRTVTWNYSINLDQ